MLLKPDLVVSSAHELSPALLKEYGIRAVMVDLDDTLVAANAETLKPNYRHWIKSLQQAQIPVLMLSNGKRERVKRWSQELGIIGLPLVGKPFTFAFRKGLKLLGTKAAETAMIGDQLFTDVLGANLIGVMSILVTPLSAGKLLHTRAARKLEEIILRGGNHGSSVHR